MHELYLVKVPETLDTKTLMHPVTIMTRSPVGMTTIAALDLFKVKNDEIEWIAPNCAFLNPFVFSSALGYFSLL